jgi:hypothetical protein
MANARLDRRDILKGIGAVGALGALATVPNALPAHASAEAGADPSGIEGTWLSTMINKSTMPMQSGAAAPQMIAQVLCTYTGGGGLLATGTTDEAAGSRSSPGHGAWVRVGPRTTRYTVKAFGFDDKGNLANIGTFGEVITLGADGMSYTGKGEYRVVDLKRKVIDRGTITSKATRVNADDIG